MKVALGGAANEKARIEISAHVSISYTQPSLNEKMFGSGPNIHFNFAFNKNNNNNNNIGNGRCKPCGKK